MGNSRIALLFFRVVLSVIFSAQFAAASELGAGQAVDLLDYVKTHSLPETVDQLATEHPGYNRAEHFGGWIQIEPGKNCYDTRTDVLIRDADPKKPITFSRNDKCKVSKATWLDPYTAKVFKLARAVQIDHVVPLKHAYLTGAYAWTSARRCTYANFLADNFHLLAVSGHENMSKGDRSPESYLPPNKAFLCEYLADWMKVKAVWELKSTDAEVAAIEKTAEEQHCSPDKLSMSSDELAQLRRKTNEAPAKCIDF